MVHDFRWSDEIRKQVIISSNLFFEIYEMVRTALRYSSIMKTPNKNNSLFVHHPSIFYNTKYVPFGEQ